MKRNPESAWAACDGPKRSELVAVLVSVGLALSAFIIAGRASLGPFSFWLSWISLIPLLLCVRLCGPVRAAFCGGLWGAWVLFFQVMGFLSGEPLYWPGVVVLVLVPGVYTFFGSLLTRRVGFDPLLLGLGWAGVELALSPLGLRHGLLAGALGEGMGVQVLGGLLGYVVLAFLVALVNAAVLAALDEVGGYWGQSRFVPQSDDDRGWLITLTPSCVPVSAPRPAGPRAPPA